uniref:Putative lipocalin-3 1 n=1 Tax=Amblyomma parvum TaxID=251391 RepID=A0A023G0H7_AMBPA
MALSTTMCLVFIALITLVNSENPVPSARAVISTDLRAFMKTKENIWVMYSTANNATVTCQVDSGIKVRKKKSTVSFTRNYTTGEERRTEKLVGKIIQEIGYPGAMLLRRKNNEKHEQTNQIVRKQKDTTKKIFEILEYADSHRSCGVFSTWLKEDKEREPNAAPVREIPLSCEIRARDLKGETTTGEKCIDKFIKICSTTGNITQYRTSCLLSVVKQKTGITPFALHKQR